MEGSESALQACMPRKKVVKQVTGKRDDSALHSAARAGKIWSIREIIDGVKNEEELHNLLSKQNSAGETTLFVAAEYSYFEVVREMIKHYDLAEAGINARNGLDTLHIAAKQGGLVGCCLLHSWRAGKRKGGDGVSGAKRMRV
ncbi:hypothetical protein ACS0TY_005525 [Phlomoides rotata]